MIFEHKKSPLSRAFFIFLLKGESAEDICPTTNERGKGSRLNVGVAVASEWEELFYKVRRVDGAQRSLSKDLALTNEWLVERINHFCGDLSWQHNNIDPSREPLGISTG